MKRTFKSAVSVFLSILMLLSVLPATVYAQDSQQYSIRIVNVDNGSVDVSSDTGTVISLKENERVQLKAIMADGTEIPEDLSVSWYSATPYLACVDETGLVTGRDSSKGAIFRVWVDTNIASIWLIGPSLADSIYSVFDDMNIDSMDSEGIIETFKTVATPILGETIVNGLADSLLNTLSTINVEIKATLTDSNSNELASQSEVDSAAAALTQAYSALGTSQPISSVSIVSDTAEREGDVIYVKVPWYALYKGQTVDLSVDINDGVDVQSVTWSYSNWSVDSPEGELTSNGENAQVESTSITAGSTWITVTVEDAYGNEMSDTVKVRFIKYDWQK